MWLCQYRGDTPHILLDEYKTYGHQGSGDIYCKIAEPDLERSHTAAENTLFTDGFPHIKPLIIFKEKRFRFSNAKKPGVARWEYYSNKKTGIMMK